MCPQKLQAFSLPLIEYINYKSAYDKAIHFDNFLVVAGAVKENRCFCGKKSEEYVILCALKRAKDTWNVKILIFSRKM